MKIKNWERFQHFKDRRPPWIKLYRDILDQRDISLISDCSFRVLVGLWLLASEDETMEGNLPDVETIAFRLRMDLSRVINALEELTPFLYHVDITAISPRYQSDAPETETETETDKRKSKPKRKANGRFIPPTVEQVQAYCRDKGYKVDAHKFVDFYEAKDWMIGKNRMKCWEAAVRTWSRNSSTPTSSLSEYGRGGI